MFEKGIEFGRQIAASGGRGVQIFGGRPLVHSGEFFSRGLAPFAWIPLAVFAAVIVALIVMAVVCANKRKKAALLEPLKLKFVNGDIDKSTYLSKKAVLLGK